MAKAIRLWIKENCSPWQDRCVIVSLFTCVSKRIPCNVSGYSKQFPQVTYNGFHYNIMSKKQLESLAY